MGGYCTQHVHYRISYSPKIYRKARNFRTGLCRLAFIMSFFPLPSPLFLPPSRSFSSPSFSPFSSSPSFALRYGRGGYLTLSCGQIQAPSSPQTQQGDTYANHKIGRPMSFILSANPKQRYLPFLSPQMFHHEFGCSFAVTKETSMVGSATSGEDTDGSATCLEGTSNDTQLIVHPKQNN